jgi:hypothetical protein
MSTFAWVLVAAFGLYGLGLALDLWQRPVTWERTFAACSIAASPAFVIEELALSGTSTHRCRTLHASCFDYYYVHAPIFVGAIVFCFVLAGCMTGRSLRGVGFHFGPTKTDDSH